MARTARVAPAEGAQAVLRPWTPPVPGIREVLHADFPPGAHAYPMHVHDAWTLLLIDRGVVHYRLEGRRRLAGPGEVTLLPPHVPHDGAAVAGTGFHKRVLYLAPGALDPHLVAAAVRRPATPSARLRAQVSALHAELDAGPRPVDVLAAEHRLVDVTAALRRAWLPGVPPSHDAADRRRSRRVAEQLRDLLEADVAGGVTLQQASQALGASPSALVHAFRRRFDLSPHRYLVSRRLDLARGLLLAGVPAAEAAVRAGFHDQAHLARHFKRLLGIPPGAWATSDQGPRS